MPRKFRLWVFFWYGLAEGGQEPVVLSEDTERELVALVTPFYPDLSSLSL